MLSYAIVPNSRDFAFQINEISYAEKQILLHLQWTHWLQLDPIQIHKKKSCKNIDIKCENSNFTGDIFKSSINFRCSSVIQPGSERSAENNWSNGKSDDATTWIKPTIINHIILYTKATTNYSRYWMWLLPVHDYRTTYRSM